MNETAERLISAARACLGTPFEHQGREPGVGLDCVGLVIVALRAIGMQFRDVRTYSREPKGETMFQHVRAVLGEEMPPRHGWEDLPGGIIGFAIHGQPRHLGIRTDVGMIHALSPRGQGDFQTKVEEHNFDERWRSRAVGVWVPPGVA